MSRNTLQWQGSLVPKQTHPHHRRQRCQSGPLDTSSQVSVAEMEGSIESNPICNSPTAVAYSSHSDSPMMDLSELQVDANLAVNQMLSIKRSLDLERQWAIWDFEASLHQQEAEEATTNERPRILHSRNDLNAKAVMKAKYEYRVAIQEARVIRCSELEESEAAYLEALSENAAVMSLQCQHSAVNMQGTCMNWRGGLWMQRTRATKTSFLHIKLSYAMLHSISRRIYIPLTISY